MDENRYCAEKAPVFRFQGKRCGREGTEAEGGPHQVR